MTESAEAGELDLRIARVAFTGDLPAAPVAICMGATRPPEWLRLGSLIFLIALPSTSYSQKSIEKLIGFPRVLPERDGLWAVNRLTEAREARNPDRQAAIREVIAYLDEDLKGLQAICQWLLAEHL